MSASRRARLSGMMAGVYGVQGAWWPLLAVHLSDLGISGRARGWIFATLAIGSIVSAIAAGQLADRILPAPRLLTLIYGLGTGLLALLAFGLVPPQAFPLFAVFLIYWLLTAPATSLSSTIAFRNLDRPAAQFGRIRMWGTIGWMSVGWLVSLVMGLRGSTQAGQGAYEAFGVATGLSALIAVYCLTLPRTPPLRTHATAPSPSSTDHLRDFLLKPGVGVLLFVAFGVSLTTPFVYQVVPAYLPTLGLPRPWIASAMSLGQILEIASLAVLPRLLGRLGFRRAMTLGIAAWLVYHGVMALRPPLAAILTVLPVQGLAISLFHITAAMYLDTQAPPDRRATTQGLYIMATTGLGNLLGSLLAGEIVDRVGEVAPPVFLVPCAMAAAMFGIFVVAFRTKSTP